MDKECFELCKEVYKRFPEWNNTKTVYSLLQSGTQEEQIIKDHIGGFESELVPTECLPMGQEVIAPFYTSDYILERLIVSINCEDTQVQDEPHVELKHSGVAKPRFSWDAKAFSGEWYEVSSDTPLKALLKLVIALNDAKELV